MAQAYLQAKQKQLQIYNRSKRKMGDCPPGTKPFFFKETCRGLLNPRPSVSNENQICRSEGQLALKKMATNKTQIFPKQYTNKYFRNSSLYEQKQNEKLSQLSRFYSFMRKTKIANKFKQKRNLASKTQPNEKMEENHEKINHVLHQMKFRSIRNKNCANPDKNSWFQTRQKAAQYFGQESSHKGQLQGIKGVLKQISVNNMDNNTIFPKEKISTSRALQKYARLIKQQIFHTSKSQIFDRSPIKRQRKHHNYSNIETKQLILCTKNVKDDSNTSKELTRSFKNRFGMQKGRTISQFSRCLHEQSFDINGWQTTS